MTIARTSKAVPLEFRLDNALDHAKRRGIHSFPSAMLSVVDLFRWSWWHTKAYVPIVSVLLLAVGSLVVLQGHWLYRRMRPVSPTNKTAARKRSR